MKPLFLFFAVGLGAALPVAAQNAPFTSPMSAPVAASEARGVSLGGLLQLAPAQLRQLERISAQLSASGDGKSESQSAALQLKARQVLSPVQRSVLDSMARDSRYQIRRDALYALFVDAPFNPAADNKSAADEQARRNWQDARRPDGSSRLNKRRGSGSYGVYGGLDNGGPQAGVYGGYGRGGVGVHAGIGTRGPSIGVSVGRVFGLGRR